MPNNIVPDKFAVFVVDPGGTTGCCTGVFRTDKGDDMLKTVIARAIKKDQVKSWEVKGEVEEQAWDIVTAWAAFRFKCNVTYSIPIPNIYLVFEDFQLRELQAKLMSVGVIYGCKTLLIKGVPKMGWGAKVWPIGKIELQQPSAAKRRTNQMLRDLGLWVVGSEHERDTRRHLLVKVNDVLDGKS